MIGALPAGPRVVTRYSLEDYLTSAPDVVEEVLTDLGISAREVLFNTGDVGEDALPFLYANLDASIGAYVRVQPLGQAPVEQETLIPMTRGFVHLLRSHTTDLASCPLSSVFRLLFAITAAARDTLEVAPLGPTQPTTIPPVGDAPAMDLADWEAELDTCHHRSRRNRSTSRAKPKPLALVDHRIR